MYYYVYMPGSIMTLYTIDIEYMFYMWEALTFTMSEVPYPNQYI